MEKAEKISVSDLSIGDWVRDGNGIIAKVRGIENWSDEYILNVQTISESICTLSATGALPIPITAEVLEKSGFAHDKWSKRIWRYEDEESEVVYYIENGVLEITTDDCKINLVCKSVAELQHALRLAKVGKEIVI